jgi:hypothetical protein
MEWITRYQPQRERYWPEVEHYFGQLPASLFRQGLLLRHNLASAYSDTGQFEDILCRPRDYPLLNLHFWLLDDWHFPPGEARAKLEKHLFLATVFTFAAVATRESILDPDTAFDQRYALLENTLHQRAVHQLAQLFTAQSSFWDYYRRLRADCARALSKFQGGARKAAPFNEDELLELGQQLAFAKIPLAAVALQFDRTQQLPQLFSLLDHWHVIFQIRREITTLQRDLRRRGQPTYLIVRAMSEAGMDLDQPASPERVLGALLLTGSVLKIGQECLARLEVCRTLARELNLTTFDAYTAGVEENIREVMALFSLAPKSPASQPEVSGLTVSPIAFTPWRDSLAQAIQMAEAHLLADRTFQESWEVQRRGVFDAPELVAKGFTPGLIVEILCQHRTDLAEQVNQIFQTIAGNGFKYYPHPSLPPDADDLGLLLRLYHYSSRPEEHRALLEAPLRWMEANRLPSGQIPCWFTKDTGFELEASVVLWGNRCATVEANLLLGLLAYDRAAYWPVIERASRRWLERYLSLGLGANTYYTPAYALWVAFELLAQLSTGGEVPNLQSQIEQVLVKLVDRLQGEAHHPLTPQTAALFTLICLGSSASPEVATLFDPDWITGLLKTQRYDGSWEAEPLAITPTRGEFASWYASRLVTTAFCYHALKTYRRWQAGESGQA